jgi:hypothetical protein
MKNIHLISTDKPSRLHFDDKLFLSTNPQISKDINSIVEGRNIYITSNEEIKEGDWVISNYGELIKISYKGRKVKQNVNEFCKKIILTTDQDLIKDGVQDIDDDFLEWFVKNPSCETVEIDRDEREVGNHLGGVVTEYGDYKIIIPEEEPKSHIEYTNTDDFTSMIYNQQEEEQLPTKWFKTEQISTWIGKSITRITTEGESIDESKGGHGKLIVMHQCGENKEELISQLETMIYGLKEGFENFAN